MILYLCWWAEKSLKKNLQLKIILHKILLKMVVWVKVEIIVFFHWFQFVDLYLKHYWIIILFCWCTVKRICIQNLFERHNVSVRLVISSLSTVCTASVLIVFLTLLMFQEIHTWNCPFYCVNTSYPMDICLSGRHISAYQTTEKIILCVHWLGRSGSVRSPGGASYFLPVYTAWRQTSFPFGACSVQTEFLRSFQSEYLWQYIK